MYKTGAKSAAVAERICRRYRGSWTLGIGNPGPSAVARLCRRSAAGRQV